MILAATGLSRPANVRGDPPLLHRSSRSGNVVCVLHACALTVDVHIPASHSLKEKRAVVRHLVEGARSRFEVASAEIGYQDQWQRCEFGFAVVAGTHGHVVSVLESVERFVWSSPEVEVVSTAWTWLEPER